MTDRIIVALDVDSINKAEKYIKRLSSVVKIFKIGPRLFVPYGLQIIELVNRNGGEVFLDLKLHDIPTQVAETVKKICKFGIKMFTVHALGGKRMLSEVRKVLDKYSKDRRPLMLAVTILTSIEEKDLHFLGFKNKINILVYKLAELALNSGADGIVCSVKELEYLRSKIKRDFIAVTPGIRLTKKIHDDQRRIATPDEAWAAGANYIVIGRPILNARNPEKIVKEAEK
ncbi:MAG TPA: orotidine-5'-phosphate decarboxylase [Candidatus Omnitrophica bacterium]|nr:orotidine-5'-phosphate decarboxylase [Candidatus Omnitrophota bacterium]